MLNSKTNFYGCYIYPCILSFDKKLLSDSEKILLSIIITLSKNEKGYCYIGNVRLANCLGKNIQQITRTVTSLVNKGFIERNIILKPNTKVVEQRRLYLTEKTYSLIENNTTPTIKNDYTPLSKNDNININKDISNKVKDKKGTSSRSLYISLEDYSNEFILDESIKSILDYYLKTYKYNRGQEHPNLRKEQWKRIEENLNLYTKEYDLDIGGWIIMIDGHFKIRYEQNCDYKLLHFISPKIIENRYYEKIY